jgi:predicted deacylase
LNAHPVHIRKPHIERWAASSVAPYVHERLGNAPGPDVLITALVHGNEYSGAIVVDELLASGWQPTCGRVTFAFGNTAAFERFDPEQPDASRFVDEDLNRVWSAARLASTDASGELNRARQLRPVVSRATHLLDLHSMHEPSTPLWVAGILPRNIAFAQALQTPCQVIIDSGHQDGVRMRDHGEFSNPDGQRIALLLEAGQHWQASSVSVAKNALARFLVQAGSMDMADAPKNWLLANHTPPSPVLVTDRIVAQSMDFAFTQAFTGGEVIANAGTLIAVDAGHAIVTPYDHCVLVMPSVRQLRPGVTTVRLGKVAAAQQLPA